MTTLEFFYITIVLAIILGLCVHNAILLNHLVSKEPQ